MEYFKALSAFIEAFNKHSKGEDFEADSAFFDVCELELVKAFMADNRKLAIRVSKIILALNDVNEIKIKVE